MKTGSKKTLVFLAAALVAFAGLMVLSHQSDAATIYVPGNHATVQKAIDNASTGDTIQINTTTLTPPSVIWVNESVTIQGNGTSNTIIDGVGLAKTFNVTAENVTIKDLTVKQSDDGIYFEIGTYNETGTPETQTPSNATVTNVYIHNCTQHGVYVAAGLNCTLVNSTIENNGGDTDNYGGLYLTADQRWAIVGNLFNGNAQNAIYSTENTNVDTSVFLYNMFQNSSTYGIESPGGTIRADHNCWYNETAGTWGAVPGAAGVDNISDSVTASIYYNGTVTNSGVVITSDGTATYGVHTPYLNITYHEQGRTYNHWLAAASFSQRPIGTVPSHYTAYPIYLAFNLSGTDTDNPGLGANEWANVSFDYDFADWPSSLSEHENDATVSALWHYNWTSWTEGTNSWKNTTNTGDYEGTTYANFTSNPLSPVMILLNGGPDASFTWSPSSPRVGETITFDATGSTDPEDSTLSTFHWDWDDGGTTSDAVGDNTTNSYDSVDEYDVTLTVTDWLGRSDSVTHTVNVTAATSTGVSPGSGDYSLTVTVYDSGGDVVSGATVTLKAGGVLLSTKTTDSNGQVSWSNVEGVYYITASKDGYGDMSQYVTVSSNTAATITLGTLGIAQEPVLLGLALPALILGVLALLGMFMVAYVATQNKKAWKATLGWNLLFLIVTFLAWWPLEWISTLEGIILMALFAVFSLATYMAAKDEIESWRRRGRNIW